MRLAEVCQKFQISEVFHFQGNFDQKYRKIAHDIKICQNPEVVFFRLFRSKQSDWTHIRQTEFFRTRNNIPTDGPFWGHLCIFPTSVPVFSTKITDFMGRHIDTRKWLN